jgi:hypothetical protein
VFRRSKLLWTGEGWGSNESGLGLFGTAFCFRIEDFSNAVVDYFNNQRAARIRFEHDVGRLDVAMHNAALFRGGQRARGLLNHFKRQRERQRTFAPHFGLERFAFDQFHDVETFAVLFTVVSDPRDIRMADLRGRARFAQEARSRPWILCDSSVDYFKRDDGIQHCVARAISYRHCSGAELDRKAVRADFHFKVIVLQWSRHQSTGCFGSSWFLTAAQKTQISETTKAFAFWTDLRQGSSADRTSSDGWFAFHTGKCELSI